MELNAASSRPQPALPSSAQPNEDLIQEELQRLQKEQNELAAKKEAIRKTEEQRDQLLNDLKKSIFRLKQSLQEISMEQLSMKEEGTDLDRIKDCFERHLKDLEYLDPESWSNKDLSMYTGKANELLDNATRDYDAAVQYCREQMTRTQLFGKKQKKNATEGSFKELFMQGLANHLALILFGIVALIIFILK